MHMCVVTKCAKACSPVKVPIDLHFDNAGLVNTKDIAMQSNKIGDLTLTDFALKIRQAENIGGLHATCLPGFESPWSRPNADKRLVF